MSVLSFDPLTQLGPILSLPHVGETGNRTKIGCYHIIRGISSKNELKKFKTIPGLPKDECGLCQMIMVVKFIHHEWVNK